MPREYTKQRDAMIAKGMSSKEAKKWAAINYYKKHGVAVNVAERRKNALKQRQAMRRSKRKGHASRRGY